MLTLTQYRDVAKCRIFRDDVDLLTHYVIPFTPTIALDETGKPIISLVRYRRDVSMLTDEERKTRLGGGILTMSTELAITPDQEKQIRDAISTDPTLQQRLKIERRSWWVDQLREDPKKLAPALHINMMPIKDGTVSLSVLGETAGGTGNEFVGQLVGVGKVSMLGNNRASFMAKLTHDGAVALWTMLEKNLPAIRVAYDLKYNHRLDAVTMVVWCDAKKSYNATQEMWQSLQEDASFSRRTSGNTTTLSSSHNENKSAGDVVQAAASASQASGVQIIPEADSSVVTPEQTEELIRVGNQMIADFLAGTILEFKPGEQAKFKDQPDLQTELPSYGDTKYGHHGIKFYDLKKWDESMNVRLDHRFTSKAVLESTAGPNDNLANILQGQDPTKFRTEIELNAAFYQYMDVQVVCTADFDQDPVDLVEAHIAYNATSPQGPIDASKDFVFKKDSPPQRFSTYIAGPDKKSYDYRYTVFYKETNAKLTVDGKSDESVLVVDTDRLGVLRVEIETGLIDWTKVKTALVKTAYGSGTAIKQAEFTLTQQNPKEVWLEAIAKEVTDPYRYSVTFIDLENRQITAPEQTSTAKQLVINQPLQEDLEVAVIPAGEFGTDGLISRIAVALRYEDPANKYKADDTFILDDSKKTATWKVPLMNPDLRNYQFQTTVFYSDGVTRSDDWRSTDNKVLAVGDPYGFRVQITPRLLKSPPYAFATIHLTFKDAPASILAEKTIEISDFTKPLYWRFRLGSPDRHTYKYQLTLFKDDGSDVKLPETEASQEVLVLKPPQQSQSAST